MKTSLCACGARIFFENSQCLTCGRELGFLPDVLVLSSLDKTSDGAFSTSHGIYLKCSNYVSNAVCNWMVRPKTGTLCQACRLNHVIPDLSQPKHRALWAEVEKAKRRLVYSLDRLKLPLRSKEEDPEHGLAFDIKADVEATRVLTGHEDGLITLNLAEADGPEREKMRVAMNERYRTMLGHFRHEVGHYYWDMLVRGMPSITRFREIFGDERVDYTQALKHHYASPPLPDPDSFISVYAASHPWEDFAETFAHYLHLEDTLETARDFGFLSSDPVATTPVTEFSYLMREWIELTVVMNELNRSMGQPDAYPFAISNPIKEKLRFVHALVRPMQAQEVPAAVDAKEAEILRDLPRAPHGNIGVMPNPTRDLAGGAS
jgi:hypothetical protein